MLECSKKTQSGNTGAHLSNDRHNGILFTILHLSPYSTRHRLQNVQSFHTDPQTSSEPPDSSRGQFSIRLQLNYEIQSRKSHIIKAISLGLRWGVYFTGCAHCPHQTTPHTTTCTYNWWRFWVATVCENRNYRYFFLGPPYRTSSEPPHQNRHL